MTFVIQPIDGERFAAIYAASLDEEVAAADSAAAEVEATPPKIRERANRFVADLLLGRFRRTEAHAWLQEQPAELYELRPNFHRNKTAQEIEIRFLHAQLARQFERRICTVERRAA